MQKQNEHLITSLYSLDSHQTLETTNYHTNSLEIHQRVMNLSQSFIEQKVQVLVNNSNPAETKHISGKKPKDTDDLSQIIDNYQIRNKNDVWNQLNQQAVFSKLVHNQKRGIEIAPESYKPLDNYKYAKQLADSRLTHFFDSKAKYIPLSIDQTPKISIINKWFKSLNLRDKSKALTIVDKDLVSLFKVMYKLENSQGHPGKFSTQVSECHELLGYKKCVSLPAPLSECLTFIKSSNGLVTNIHSSTLREKEGALSELVEHVRIISVKSLNDSLTIDVELIQNIDYFMKIMKLVDEEFLIREYKITKETSLAGSLLFSKEEVEIISKNKSFFHVSDSQKTIYSATGTSSQMPTLANKNLSVQNSMITLAKCILLSFEKCLNVHFQDYHKKLSPAQVQYFYIKETEMTLNPFEQDIKLATWWFQLDQSKKVQHLEVAKNFEKLIVIEHNSLKCESIDESSNENSDDQLYQINNRLQQINCDSQFGIQRRKRKDRGSKKSSNKTSSIDNYSDYNQRQLQAQYGDLSDESLDLEAQRPTQSPLFLNIDNSMYKARQNLVHRALQATDLPQSLMFIKNLSLSKTFQNSINESASGEIQPKLMSDVKRILHLRYYDYLEKAFQQSLDAEIELLQAPESKNKKKKNKKKKKSKDVPDPVQQLGVSLGLNNILADSPKSCKSVQELPVISVNLSFKQREHSSDSSQLGITKAMETVQNTHNSQEDQLLLLARKLEKITTCEKMLNEGVIENHGHDFLLRLLHDISDEECTKYEEQRTGLLTNEVLWHKHLNLQELQDERTKLQEQGQLKYLISSMNTFSINSVQDLSDDDSDKEELQSIRKQIQEIQPEKKKRKKHKKKKSVAIPVVQPVTDVVDGAPVIEVEEIVCQPSPPPAKPNTSVRKNNFFSDDSSSVSSQQQSVTYLTGREQSRENKRKPVIKKQQPQKKASKIPQVQPKKPKKKVLVKGEAIEAPISIFTIAQTPQIMPKPVQIKFSDDVKIPSRGSIASGPYQEEDIEHKRTLEELDQLFSSSSGKLRSSTVEKTRNNLQVSQFNLMDDLDDLEDLCEAQSVKVEKQEGLDGEQEKINQIEAEQAIKALPQLLSPQKKPKRQPQKTPKYQTKQPPKVQQFKPKTQERPKVVKTFESYDSMFQNIYGAGQSATSAGTQGTTEPKMTTSNFSTSTVTTTVIEETKEVIVETRNKLSKKQMKKVMLLQETGVMATPNFFKKEEEGPQMVLAPQPPLNDRGVSFPQQFPQGPQMNVYQQPYNPFLQNQIQIPQYPQMFPQPQSMQFYPQMVPQPYHQMFYQQIPFPQQRHGLAPYDVIPLVDQIQVDKRLSGNFNQHEFVFHCTIGSQLIAVQQKVEAYLAEAEEAHLHSYELIQRVVRDTFPELSLRFDVYGSMATKLAIDSSDMDIAIYGIQPEARCSALQQLHTKLNECKSVTNNLLILTASVPVVKLELSFAGLAEDLKISEVKFGKIKSIKIDIVLNDQDGTQLHQTKQCAEFIKKKIIEHPFLKPLTITLKKYLTIKNMNSPFQGTMSSYGLVLLVLALLKDMARMNPPLEYFPPQMPQSLMSLGRVFTHFFSVYGDPNLFNETVIINQALQFELAQDSHTYQSIARPLVIQDPIDSYNNVGKQIYNFFSHVQEQLQVTQKVLLVRFRDLQSEMAQREALDNDLRMVQANFKTGDETLLEQQIKDQIGSLSQTTQQKLNELLGKIVMMDLTDLTPIYRDETEERQKNLLHATKQMASILQPFEKHQALNQQLQNLFFHPMQLGMMQPEHHSYSPMSEAAMDKNSYFQPK